MNFCCEISNLLLFKFSFFHFIIYSKHMTFLKHFESFHQSYKPLWISQVKWTHDLALNLLEHKMFAWLVTVFLLLASKKFWKNWIICVFFFFFKLSFRRENLCNNSHSLGTSLKKGVEKFLIRSLKTDFIMADYSEVSNI